MNRFNNKKYYKPPPVKPSNKLREKSKEEWNPYKSGLNKYKLSNAEILKKKMNTTSQNGRSKARLVRSNWDDTKW